jgi:uncharacterized membrane protein
MMRRDVRAHGARVLLVALAALPLAPRLSRGLPGLAWLGPLGLRWFAVQCQRDPARSLVIVGETLPVCARCSGIYLGFGLGALVLRPRLTPAALRIWVLPAGALMLLDVLSEALGLRPAWAPLRLVSGVLLSYPLGACALAEGPAQPFTGRKRYRSTVESRALTSAACTSS